ncbi:hypothetical protein HPB52_021205 [Rhipicephalus sanguineus]|uniref:Uncharacterized protein n=1 Tax=Rhipicephalus sanguineus TaxID=34632 RepID=A0A9D4Q2S6_RHISA|nr:hypothetical protein HPB52_021205 [Rhipicephalus sanguineus]
MVLFVLFTGATTGRLRRLLGGVVSARRSHPTAWWILSGVLEKLSSPEDSEVATESRVPGGRPEDDATQLRVPVQPLDLGRLLGYNTFIAHFDNASARLHLRAGRLPSRSSLSSSASSSSCGEAERATLPRGERRDDGSRSCRTTTTPT